VGLKNNNEIKIKKLGGIAIMKMLMLLFVVVVVAFGSTLRCRVLHDSQPSRFLPKISPVGLRLTETSARGTTVDGGVPSCENHRWQRQSSENV